MGREVGREGSRVLGFDSVSSRDLCRFVGLRQGAQSCISGKVISQQWAGALEGTGLTWMGLKSKRRLRKGR